MRVVTVNYINNNQRHLCPLLPEYNHILECPVLVKTKGFYSSLIYCITLLGLRLPSIGRPSVQTVN